jgi:formylglycine-generating enzyme required for sulfatase activity
MPVRYEFCKFCSRVYDAEAAACCPHCAPLKVLPVAVPQEQATESEPNQMPARNRYGKLARIAAWSVILLIVGLGVAVQPFFESRVAPITDTPAPIKDTLAPIKDTPVPIKDTPVPITDTLTASQEQALKPKDRFKECANCPQMLVVPSGSFIMGSPKSEPMRFGDEDPQRTITVARQFGVGQFALTFDEWDACVAAGGCNGYRPNDQGWGRGRRPIINVSWSDAKAYVAWLAQLTGKPYRLLSEAEYEYAARAGTATAYPWGNDIGRNNANCNGCGSQWDAKQTAQVGSFAANQFGLYDMAGNVRQWTEDCYHNDYRGAPADSPAWTSWSCSERVTRGGSWSQAPIYLRSALRYQNDTGSRLSGLGFRVARTLPGP